MHERITVNGYVYVYDRLVYEHHYEGQDAVHAIVTVREDGADVCTCGLVLEDGADLLQALGHVDPATKQPCSAIVLHIPRQAYYRIACQECAWQQARPTLALATACRRRHQCPPVALHRQPIGLRTREDLLAAALERTGWTVEADDPRATAFLERTVELVREQNAGRIDIVRLHETLRREFPLR
jgi:hypothetical protein